MEKPRTNNNKIDSWIDDDIWNALEAYMKQAGRKRADAIRILLKKSLELEGLMRGVKQ
jgi:hypothetical protein